MSARLALGDGVLEVRAGQPAVMGIVNASPDSFSDAGERSLQALVERAAAMVEEGAALIDVGGESGRTDTEPVPAAVEIERVAPLVERLAQRGIAVSIDSWKVDVAAAALRCGAVLVNDTSGLRDPAMADLCAEAGAALVVTHTGAPPKVKSFPDYGDVVAEVRAFLEERVAAAVERGVPPERIAVDPGVDLGKRPAESVELLRRLDELGSLGRPLLLAVSRKDFIGALLERRPRERLAGTLAAVGEGIDRAPAILRVHDVGEVSDFLRVRAALRGDAEVPPDLALPEPLRRERPAYPSRP
jgi:dihydropteroate synthase